MKVSSRGSLLRLRLLRSEKGQQNRLAVLPPVIATTSSYRQLHITRAPAYAQVVSDHRSNGDRSKGKGKGKDGKERLVILGSGWGAMSLLKSLDQKLYEVCVVSPNTYFAMTPLLAQAATGTLELRATMEPVRGNHYTKFYHAWAEAINLDKQTLTLMPAYPPAFREADPFQTPSVRMESGIYPNARGGHSTMLSVAPHRRAIEAKEEEEAATTATTTHQGLARGASASANSSSGGSGDDSSNAINESHHSHNRGETWKSMEEGREYELSFDKLVISVGAYNRTFSTPGVRENAWFLKDVQNARSIRWRILECFEQADHPNFTDEQRRRLLNFIIVGGGPTGSEFAAELHDLCSSDLKRLFPDIIHLVKISIVDASDGILNNFDASLATYAREKFKRDGIDLLLNRRVKEVQRGNLVVEPDGERESASEDLLTSLNGQLLVI